MDKALFSLAIQGLRRSKGKALRVLAVLAVSFGFALASLSLSASIQATNQEFAKNIYGEWYLGVLAAQERDGAWLSRQRWLIQLGTARPWGQVDTPTGPAALGTLDEGMRQVGRLRLSAGRWPQAEGELAAEAAVLAQGYILGACGGAMLLLLLTAALSVEAQARRPSWALLRVLGMSAAQQRTRLAGTALARCAVALAGGWLLEFGGGVTALILERAAGYPGAYEGYWIGLPTAARTLLRNWAGFGSLGQRAAVLSLLCVALPGLACWAAQATLRKLWKGRETL